MEEDLRYTGKQRGTTQPTQQETEEINIKRNAARGNGRGTQREQISDDKTREPELTANRKQLNAKIKQEVTK